MQDECNGAAHSQVLDSMTNKSCLFQRGKGHFRGLQHSEDSDSPLLSSPPPSSAPKSHLVEPPSSLPKLFFHLKWLVLRQVYYLSSPSSLATASLTVYLVINSKPLASRPEVRWQRAIHLPSSFRCSFSFSYPGKAPRKQLATKAARKTAAAVRTSCQHPASNSQLTALPRTV